jgi:hypothetical protein
MKSNTNWSRKRRTRATLRARIERVSGAFSFNHPKDWRSDGGHLEESGPKTMVDCGGRAVSGVGDLVLQR